MVILLIKIRLEMRLLCLMNRFWDYWLGEGEALFRDCYAIWIPISIVKETMFGIFL